MRGAETLYLRDVLNTHLEMKVAQAEAMRRGSLPLIDPYRAGGQPLLGNPNAVPLYPDNLLYLFASPLWALNAHFWIHLLLAPLAMFWMARAWGLSREGAWAAAVCYALSGYVLSEMSFYNLIAGVALAPALVAACLDLAAEVGGRWRAPAVAAVWCLLILAGDPPTALLALILALAAVAAKRGEAPARPAPPGTPLRLAAALACGTLLAVPQIVEFLRIVGTSYRGSLGYSGTTQMLASWDPRQIAEWLLPFFFGRPDRLGAGAFWGYRFFTDRPPYFYSLYPGLLSLALAVTGLRRTLRAALWGAGGAAAGLFFALGRFNPAGSWLFALGGGTLRYPVKFYLMVAVGGALLAGLGFESAVVAEERRGAPRLRVALAALAAILAIAALGLALFQGPVESWIRALLPAGVSTAAAATAERLRWEAGCLGALGVIALLGLAILLARRRPVLGGALMLAVHAGAQIVLLAPLLASDSVAPYLAASPLLDAIPVSSRVVHGSVGGLFGDPSPRPADDRGMPAFMAGRRAAYELYPFAGALRGRRYELDVSPEGLDSFLTTAARDGVRISSDAGRLRLLASWGVDFLILDRELDAAALDQVRPVQRFAGPAGSVFVYRIAAAAPVMALVGNIVRAPSLNDAVAILEGPGFDPRSTVVLPGRGDPVRGPGGALTILADDAESLRADVEAVGPGVLVIQRAFLPLYRATLDGVAVGLKIANLHRIAIEIPTGRHDVRIEADHRPFAASLGAVFLGLCGVALLARRD